MMNVRERIIRRAPAVTHSDGSPVNEGTSHRTTTDAAVEVAVDNRATTHRARPSDQHDNSLVQRMDDEDDGDD
jgi:hypothetical protein